jgi:hypothetical protein
VSHCPLPSLFCQGCAARRRSWPQFFPAGAQTLNIFSFVRWTLQPPDPASVRQARSSPSSPRQPRAPRVSRSG